MRPCSKNLVISDKVLCGTLLEKLSNNSAIRLSAEGTVLDLNAAKFFLAKYENKAGDEYLAYLVKHESVTMGLSTHTDPTNLTELLGNPDTILRLAQNWKDALAVAEEQKERADKAIRDRGKISSSREAFCMAKVGVVKRKLKIVSTENETLKEKLDLGENWKSVTGWAVEFKDIDVSNAKAVGKILSQISRAMEIEVRKVQHERWGEVNSYNREVMQEYARRYLNS